MRPRHKAAEITAYTIPDLAGGTASMRPRHKAAEIHSGCRSMDSARSALQ